MSLTPMRFIKLTFFFYVTTPLEKGRKTFKYAFTVVDVATRFNEAKPLTSKNSDEAAKAFAKIYRPSPLKWPKMLEVDSGKKFMGAVSKEMKSHKTFIGRERTEVRRDQAIVERLKKKPFF